MSAFRNLTIPFAFVVLGCSGEVGSLPPSEQARVNVTNAGVETVDVVLTPLDGLPVVFEGIVADTTTPSRRVRFPSVHGVQVSCISGCVEGSVNLSIDGSNTIRVSEDTPPLLNPGAPARPEVVQLTPGDGEAEVGLNTTIAVAFSHSMDPVSIDANTVGAACSGALQLSSDDFATCVALAGPTASSDNISFVASPVVDLMPLETYRIKITTDARNDADGERLESEVVASFTTASEADTSPPGEVRDLELGAVTTTTVELLWTAVGDDGDAGTAATYDLRYAPGKCPFSFESGKETSPEPAPDPAGTSERFRVRELNSGTDYCFGLRVADEAQNVSVDSNQVDATTLEEDWW